MVKPPFDLGDRKSIKETIQSLMLQKIAAGEVRNHKDVRDALSELDGLEFKPLTEKQLEKRRRADAEAARGGKPRRRRADPTDVERLRAAFEKSIERRAAKKPITICAPSKG